MAQCIHDRDGSNRDSAGESVAPCPRCDEASADDDAPSFEIEWQVRAVDDMLLTAPDLPTLRRWIAQGRLLADDEVSRTGHVWLRVADMPEFAGTFASSQPVEAREGMANDGGVGPPPVFAGAPERGVPSATLEAEWGHLRGAVPVDPKTVLPSQRGAQPRSLLDLVTSHVQPIIRASSERVEVSPAVLDRVADAVGPSPVVPWWGRRVVVAAGVATVVLGAALVTTAGFPEVIASLIRTPGIGRSVGAGVAVAHEDRRRVSEPEPTRQPLPPLHDVSLALRYADPELLDRADGGLTRTFGQAQWSDAQRARLRLLHAEVLATRALIAQIHAAIDPRRTAQERWLTADRLRRADAMLAGTNVRALPRSAVDRARLRLELARGGEVSIEPSGDPLDAATEAFILGRGLWHGGGGPVAGAVIERLRSLEEASVVARLLVGLALLRTARPAEAAEEARTVLDRRPGHAVAVGLLSAADKANAHLGVSADGVPVTESSVDPPESFTAARARGCEAIDNGKPGEGVALLRRVYRRRPRDVGALMCMGEGHLKLRAPSKALVFFERALERRPSSEAALRGAARASRRSGDRDLAIHYYARVLDDEPLDAEARVYLAKQEIRERADAATGETG